MIPLYLPEAKIAEIITPTKESIAEISENIAKPLQIETDCNRSQIATIPEIVNNPITTTRIMCIFPLYVVNSPPSSSGKKKAISIPTIELIRKSIGPIIEPPPSLIPSCSPMKKTNNRILSVTINNCAARLLGAPTAKSELISSRI